MLGFLLPKTKRSIGKTNESVDGSSKPLCSKTKRLSNLDVAEFLIFNNITKGRGKIQTNFCSILSQNILSMIVDAYPHMKTLFHTFINSWDI